MKGILHAADEDHRHGRSRVRHRRTARRAHRSRHGHRSAQLLARHARIAGRDLRARAGRGPARQDARWRSCRISAVRRSAPVCSKADVPSGSRPATNCGSSPATASAGPGSSRRPSKDWRAACSRAITCSCRTASSNSRVIDSDGSEIRTTVVEGGMLGEHKGINAPGVRLPTSAITLKDVEDLQFGLSLGVDLVALSFVQSADDMRLRAPDRRGQQRRRAAHRQDRAAAGARAISTRSSTAATW